MKKMLILAGVVGLLSTTIALAQEETVNPQAQTIQPLAVTCEPPVLADNCSPFKACKGDRFQKFEEQLKLSDEQKEKVKALREKEHEQLEPIFQKIKEKRDAEKVIMEKRLTAEERFNELAPIKKDLRALGEDIRKVRMANKQEFEKILTNKQVKKLEQLKADARKNFKKHHHHKVMTPQNMPPRRDFDVQRGLQHRCPCEK